MWRHLSSDLRAAVAPRVVPAVAVLLFVLSAAILTRGVLPGDWPLWVRVATALALAAGQSVPVLWWRRDPVRAWAVLMVVCGAAHLLEVELGATTGTLFTPGQFAVLVVLHGAGLTRGRAVTAAVAGTTLVAGLVVEVTQPETVALTVLSAVLLGRSRAAGAEIARALAVREERTRIARELHDVVAHHMSVLAVQAETAPYRLDGLAPRTEGEFRELAEQARQALGEMRDLLGALRGGDEAERGPQPTLDQVESLVDSVRRVGTPVELEFDDRLRRLDPVRALSVYRIVQESLSNALKHAPGQPLEVRLTRAGGAVRVHVRNRLLTDVGPPGQGIPGMRERVDLLGGTFRAGPDGAGRFVVDAVVPERGGAG